MQAIGNYVAVAVEGDNDNALVEFYRVFDNPERLNFYKLEGNTFRRTFTNSTNGQEGHAGAVAITRLRELGGSDYSCRYVMAVCGSDCEDMDFYVSELPNLENPGEWIEFDSISNVPGQSTHEDYQNINFINQCDGKLFLAGFDKDVSHDEIELWEVTLANENPYSRHGLSASMTRIGEYH